MPRSNDKTGAALLVAAVVLLAGSFAGFSFGATGHDIRSANQATPLLLQSTTVMAQEVPPCTEPAARGARAVYSAKRAPAPPAPRPTPAARTRPIST